MNDKICNTVKNKRNKKIEVIKEKIKKKRCNTRTSQEVTHPSTTLAQARLTAEFRWDPVH